MPFSDRIQVVRNLAYARSRPLGMPTQQSPPELSEPALCRYWALMSVRSLSSLELLSSVEISSESDGTQDTCTDVGSSTSEPTISKSLDWVGGEAIVRFWKATKDHSSCAVVAGSKTALAGSIFNKVMINVNQDEDYGVQIGKGVTGWAKNARKGAVGRHQRAPWIALNKK